MNEQQASEMIKALERIAIALEKLAKDSEQKMEWEAGGGAYTFYDPEAEDFKTVTPEPVSTLMWEPQY